MTVKIPDLWNATPCSLVYDFFGRTFLMIYKLTQRRIWEGSDPRGIKCEVLKAVTMKIPVLWTVTPCSW
jgi:hypothetical protein